MIEEVIDGKWLDGVHKHFVESPLEPTGVRNDDWVKMRELKEQKQSNGLHAWQEQLYYKLQNRFRTGVQHEGKWELRYDAYVSSQKPSGKANGEGAGGKPVTQGEASFSLELEMT